MKSGGAEVSDPIWARMLYLVGYWFVGGTAFSLAALLGLAQLTVMWIRGRPHEGLECTSAALACYARHCLAYIVFSSDTKPYPLGPLPERM